MKVTKRQIRRLIKEIRFTTRGPVGGPFAMVWSYFDNGEGWKWKTKSSDEAIAFLPTGDGGPDGSLGYYVKIEHKMGTYNMSWTKRTELPGRRVKVIRPQNGWTAGSIPNEIKTAVDEINYDIAQHDAQAEASPGSRPGEHKLDFGKDIGTYNYIEEGTKVKVTKSQLKRIIKEERAKLLKEEPSDYYRDYKSGTISYEDYQQMVRDYERSTGDGPYRSDSYARSPRKTSYVGVSANKEQIEALEAALMIKKSNFLSSVLEQLRFIWQAKVNCQKDITKVRSFRGGFI